MTVSVKVVPTYCSKSYQYLPVYQKFLSSNSGDILFITETWLYNDITGHEVFRFKDFVVVIRCDRLNGVHGGVLIACRKGYSFNLLHSYSFRDFSCSIVIKVNQTFFCLMVIYNPPLSSDYRVESSTFISDVQNHHDEVLKHIGRCQSDQTVFAVLEDFNLAEVCWSSYYAYSEYSMKILSAFDDLNLFQLGNFLTILSGNALDLFWSNDPQRFVVNFSQRKLIQTFIQFSLICMSLVMIVLHLMSQSNCIQRRV